MAYESAHRLTKRETTSAERHLALEIRSWQLGFAVLEGPNLLDWGVCRFSCGQLAVAINRLRLLLTTYAPSTAIARRTRRAKGESSEIAARLLRKIRRELERRSVRFVVLTRADVLNFFVQQGCHNKNEVAVAVSDRFAQLKSRIPRPRKPWDKERSIVVVFDAAATAIAFDRLREPVAHA
jgi:hypothetical protein